MKGKRNVSIYTGILLGGFLCLFAGPLFSQDYFVFPVTDEGVYRLSQEQATAWGLGSLEEISFYGEPGALPQQVDSSLFRLKELPQKRIDDQLYVFLGQPDQILVEDGKARLEPHPYTDSLYYLIQTGTPPKNRVQDAEETAATPTSSANGLLYRFQPFKEETYNLLTSGRSWYGLRTFANGGQTIAFPLPDVPPQGRVSVHARMMAQSFEDSRFQFRLNGEPIGELPIPSVPNSRYAVKGREARFDAEATLPEDAEGISLQFTFTTSNPNGAGYLKHLLLGFPYAAATIGPGIYYRLSSAPLQPINGNYQLWNVSDFHQIQSGQAAAIDARKLAVFDPDEVPEIPRPTAVAPPDQLLSGFPELIIVTAPPLAAQAERLSRFKNSQGIPTEVVQTQAIYEAFGYGNPDISSIRNFLAYQWHAGKSLKHVLFFGKGSFDYKKKLGGRPNLVPTYSSRSSLNPLTTYGSDDFYGFLDMGKGEWEESENGDLELDIGVGRIPAITPTEAAEAVDKIIRYQTESTGSWTRKLLFIADDGDQNIHLRDAEQHAAFLYNRYPEVDIRKLYLDQFEQRPSEPTLPAAKRELAEELAEGLLLVNYTGHGNELTWAAEELFTVPDIDDWPESEGFPVFVTATCEFGRHDSPFLRSGAEELLFAHNKGAIAVLATGRPVFSSVNFRLNKAFVAALFEAGGTLTLGEIFKRTKNESLAGALNRNFSLLGDPSLRLALPDLRAHTLSLVKSQTRIETDTLFGNQKLIYQGEIQDPLTGAQINNFDGTYELRVENEPKAVETLGDESPPTTFLDYQQPLFRGLGRVEKGRFEGELLLGNASLEEMAIGKIMLYAWEESGPWEAIGGATIPLKAGTDEWEEDTAGPEMELFVFDSLENRERISSTQSPIWIYLRDPSGIQTGIPEGITLSINDNPPVSVTDFYTATDGTYQQGYVKFLLEGLKEGENTIRVSSSDIQGNVSTGSRSVRVEGSRKLQVETVLAYPNPASEQVSFLVSHNRPGENLRLKLSLHSSAGHEIFSLQRRFPKAERFLTDIQWIFLQSKTKYPAKGTYLYQIELVSEGDGTSGSTGGKIIIR
ncbi:Peptidase family C25 [Cyclobacterium xiamenense]|uniref:Peptidase family C25 n=1 Tax=Cyclobacterium xiamenense TaxID=1297121 RepID=A0A1H7A921_9BACT|nr:type IX secretion system sortase PorU [Cyclobacterium xiamenense]SEJ58572.1 Peptidase family C25 [Cyclobacterium xiamenense]